MGHGKLAALPEMEPIIGPISLSPLSKQGLRLPYSHQCSDSCIDLCFRALSFQL